MFKLKYINTNLSGFHPLESFISTTQSSRQVPSHPKHVNQVIAYPTSIIQTFILIHMWSRRRLLFLVTIIAATAAAAGWMGWSWCGCCWCG